MTFSGEYQHAIDEKGRLIIPARFRDSLGSKYMLSKGLEACLFIYPMESWTKLEERLNSLSVFNQKNRNFKRRFFSGSGECEIDRQGRTLINQEFRSYANLVRDVYIVGAGDHLEIWNKEAWEDCRVRLDEEFESLAEELFS